MGMPAGAPIIAELMPVIPPALDGPIMEPIGGRAIMALVPPIALAPPIALGALMPPVMPALDMGFMALMGALIPPIIAPIGALMPPDMPGIPAMPIIPALPPIPGGAVMEKPPVLVVGPREISAGGPASTRVGCPYLERTVFHVSIIRTPRRLLSG